MGLRCFARVVGHARSAPLANGVLHGDRAAWKIELMAASAERRRVQLGRVGHGVRLRARGRDPLREVVRQADLQHAARRSPLPQVKDRAAQGLGGRDDEKWRKHTLAWVDSAGKVKLDYRPVHTELIADGIDADRIAPKARVY